MIEEEKVGKGEREKGGGVDNSDTLYVWYEFLQEYRSRTEKRCIIMIIWWTIFRDENNSSRGAKERERTISDVYASNCKIDFFQFSQFESPCQMQRPEN